MSSLSWLEPRGFWALLLLPALWWLPFWSRASLGSARRAWSVGL
ncbi:MAG: hypothetical protein JWN48_2689, partial [Myxococcaceae bacterium]|nr:hypothetical protein [Myxococcaceae bacterium]